MCRDLCFLSCSPSHLHPFLGTWTPLLLSWSLCFGINWLSSATALGGRDALHGMELCAQLLGSGNRVMDALGEPLLLYVFPSTSPLKVVVTSPLEMWELWR